MTAQTVVINVLLLMALHTSLHGDADFLSGGRFLSLRDMTVTGGTLHFRKRDVPPVRKVHVIRHSVDPPPEQLAAFSLKRSQFLFFRAIRLRFFVTGQAEL